MGTLKFEIVGDASFGVRTKIYTIPDAHINRFAVAMQARYQVGTPNAALIAWADSVVDKMKQQVREQEHRQAGAGVTFLTTT